MTRARAARFGVLVVAWAASTPVIGVASDAAHAKTRRGTTVRAAGATTDRSAPDVTATVAKPVDATAPAAKVDDAIPPPYVLPAASRTRVRACGTVWRDMKLAGHTGDDDWRDFAVKCFTAKDGPPSAN